ncbi:hypothetical protein CPB83DRAFT_836167 [Crepidotus variabilis]|uniref:Uncharacterized protein n=1 Tax=Crepidotus variabilis TaxID=179855 RepID=A0A9P6EFD0_9AGAR|nr:hypothetical protein CPB83DRAFT_836167 [Crepidotus variabilis]
MKAWKWTRRLSKGLDDFGCVDDKVGRDLSVLEEVEKLAKEALGRKFGVSKTWASSTGPAYIPSSTVAVAVAAAATADDELNAWPCGLELLLFGLAMLWGCAQICCHRASVRLKFLRNDDGYLDSVEDDDDAEAILRAYPTAWERHKRRSNETGAKSSWKTNKSGASSQQTAGRIPELLTAELVHVIRPRRI